MRKVAGVLILATLFLWLLAPMRTSAYTDSPTPQQIPGRVEGSGTEFVITDSDYLNITLHSTQPIKLVLDSAQQMVSLQVGAASGASSSDITMGGFSPQTTYHRYDDDLHNHTAFTTDIDGGYSFTQDLSGPHVIFIQPRPSTKFINDGPTGGDCAVIGTWNADTRTCTLTTDVFETIQLDSDSITLDGDGHMVSGSGMGIYLPWRTGVTVKNLIVGFYPYDAYTYGMYLYGGSGNNITGNTVSTSRYGIVLYNSKGNTLSGNVLTSLIAIQVGDYSNNNTVADNLLRPAISTIQYGIIVSSDTNSVTGNLIVYAREGILVSGNSNTVANNFIRGQDRGILVRASSNTIKGNIISNIYTSYGAGIDLFGANDTRVYNNNFLWNQPPAKDTWRYGAPNLFNLPAPVGGNYWTNLSCVNNNGDNFCDNPYYLGGFAYDYLPLTGPIGLATDTVSPVTSISLSGALNASGYYTSDVQVSLAASDDGGSGLAWTGFASYPYGPWRTFTGPFTISAEGTTTVYYQSIDHAGNQELDLAANPVNIKSQSITIYRNNRPPTASAGGPYSVPEGGSVTLAGTGSDPDGDPLTYAWDLDNNGSFETAGQNPAFSAAGRDGPGNQTVVLQVCDSRSVCSTASATLDIANVPPTATLAVTSPVDEGGSSTLSLNNAADPSPADTQAGLHYSFACDGQDASLAPSYAAAGTSNSAVCSFKDDGSYPVKGRVLDKDNGLTTYSGAVTVNNLPPVLGPITAPVAPVLVNTLITATASFTDAGVLDTHLGIWGWGDNATSAGSISEVNGSGIISGTHIYGASNVYSVTLSLADKDGGSSQSVYQYVVVYDPSGGFVTGGGVIDSPAGAYVANPSLAGKAVFGFVAKYQQGAGAPTGETQFRFQVANMAFTSTSYQWLVVSGPKAQFKGSGTINRSGDYQFLLTATDGQAPGGGGVDRFRIKIWDKATGSLVYDNQASATDTADPTTAIAGGNIAISR